MGDLKRTPIFLLGNCYKKIGCFGVASIGLGSFLQVLSVLMNWFLSERTASLRQPPQNRGRTWESATLRDPGTKNTNGKKGASSVKKFSKHQPQTPTDADHLEPAKLCETAKDAVARSPRGTATTQQIFTVAPGVDTLTLLNQACENLASLTVLIANFAGKLEGSNRKVLLSIQHLAAVTELLVNQARENLDPRSAAPDAQPPTRH
jgi:hypothetical protein